MRAKVMTTFPGVRDGEIHPQMISKGEVIEGDLARIAVDGGLAEEIVEAVDLAGKDVDLDKLKLEELKTLAAERQIDISAAKTKAEIIVLLGETKS